ncbi:reticulocyte binding protein 2b [Plasmodium ovale curtisi]|uniref:Reticulocyte binding protein 2b n=1 Tax=Plasmodium ovale curtisi TaxID=864141 RepID=A0A1A8WJA5_PLAOA|nr:reticulocyte binding protein 2b [Plasmodium ovale curtisi]
MGKNTLLKIFYNLLFMLLGKESNRNKSSSIKERYNLSPLHYNLTKNKNFEPKKEIVSSSSYSNEKVNIGKIANHINDDGANKADISNDTSMVSLKDYKSVINPSDKAYMGKNNLYAYNRDNNKWIDQNEHTNTVANAFIQKENTPSHTQETIYYIEVTADDGYIISPMQPHYFYKYYFSAIKNYITHEKYVYEKYEVLYSSEVIPLFDRIHTDHSACNGENTNTINLLNKLLDPEKHNTNINEYISQHEEYRAKIDRFEDCLEKNHKNYMYSIEKIDKEMLNFLQLLRCTTDCDTVTYDVIVELNMENIQQIPYDWYYNFIYSFKAPFSSGVDMMEHIENELGKSVTIEATKFLQKEIIYIIERFDNHLEKYYSSVDKIIEYSKEKVPETVIKSDLIESYVNLAYFYSNIKFSGEKLKLFQEELKNKVIILLNFFRKIAKELEKKVNSLFNSQYSLPNSDSVISDLENILKSGEPAYEENSNLLKDLELYIHYEILNIKTIYREQIDELNDALAKAKELISSLKTIHKTNESEKNEVENKIKQKSDEEHSQERVSELLDIIGTIKKYNDTSKDNLIKIEQKHREANDLKIKIEELIKSIKRHRSDLEELIEIEKINSTAIKEVNRQMDYITKNTDGIKKIFSIKNEIDTNIPQIEELIDQIPHSTPQFTEKIKELKTKVMSVITHYHKYDLKQLVENVSKLEQKHKNLFSKKYTKDEIDNFLKETTEKYNKMSNMKCSNIPNIITALEKELENLLKIKGSVVNEKFQKIHAEISKTIDAAKKKFNDLTDSMNSQKEDKKKLEQYKDDITKRKGKFLHTLHEKDSQVSEGQNSYEEFSKHRDSIMNKVGTLFNAINMLKENLGNFQNRLLPIYDGTLKKLKTLANKTNPEIDALIRNFNEENMHSKVVSCEKEFKNNDRIINNFISDIENSNKNIDAIKTLNVSINIYEKSKKLLQKLEQNKDDLIEKVNKHLEAVKANKLIDPNEKKKFEDALNKEIANINKELVDTTVDKLKTQIEEISKYCASSKENIMKHSETQFEVLDEEKMNWTNIKGGITKLNARYQVLNKTIEDLVNDQQTSIIKLMDGLKNDKENEINAIIRKHITTLGQMKTTLHSFDFNNNIINDKNDLIQGKIKSLKGEIDPILRAINENNNKLNDIKERFDENIGKEDEKKGKSPHFDEQKQNMETIYEIMQNALKEINSIKDIDTILVSVKHAELQYQRLLIDDTMQQINDQKEKAKALMDDMDMSIKNIEELIRNPLDESQTITTDFNYKEHYNKGKANSNKIYQIAEDAKTQSKKAEKSEKVNELKNIKDKINASMQEVVKECNTMQEALNEINDVKKILASHDSEHIVIVMEKNTTNANYFCKQAVKEIGQADKLVKEIEANLEKSRGYENKILTSSNYEQIDAKVNEIKKIHEDFIKKKKDISIHLKIAEEYKTKALSKIHNVERGKVRIGILQKSTDESKLSDMNIGKVNQYFAKCEEYSANIVPIEEQIKKYLNTLSKYEGDISTMLKVSNILEIKTKSQKRKSEALEIYGKIEKEKSQLLNELEIYKQKLKTLEDNTEDNDKVDTFDNRKSTDANVSIQYILESVKNYLAYINNIKEDIERILSTANNSLSFIRNISEISMEDSTEEVKTKAENYEHYLSNITKQNQLMQENRNKLNGIISTIKDIENQLEEHKKTYEIIILKKINEVADERKAYMDKTNETLNTTMKTFTSLFNGLDLKEYNIEKNLQNYNAKINEINNEFEASHKLIRSKVEEVSEKSVDYVRAKKMREEAKEEEAKLKSKEDEAKKYLRDVKKKESFELIYHLKEKISNISQVCEEEYSKIDKDHKEIKNIIEGFKNVDTGISTSENLKLAVVKNIGIQNTSYYSYKNEAQNLLNHLVNAANFIGIKVVKGLIPSGLNSKTSLHQKTELNFESQIDAKLEAPNLSKNEKEMEVYGNILDAYKSLIQILKHSDDINKKQRESEQLIQEGNVLFYNIQSISQLAEKLKATMSKQTVVSMMIDDAISKSKQSRNVECNNKNCDYILEKSKCVILKQHADSFEEKRKNTVDELKLKEIKFNFDNDTKPLKNLEKEAKQLNKNDASIETIMRVLSSIGGIYQKIEDTEKNITIINSSFDDLLRKGEECELFRYTAISESVISKMKDDLVKINLKDKVQEYLAYIQNNYTSVIKDIRKLKAKFGANKISNYAVTNIQEAANNTREILSAISESKEIINDLKQKFSTDKDVKKMNILQNGAEELKNVYKKLNDKKSLINEIYIKMNLLKLKEIKTSADKYSDIATQFNNIVSSQKWKLLENQNNFRSVKTTISDKGRELVYLANAPGLKSVKKFNEIYDFIVTNIKKLKALDEINNREYQNVKMYEENLSHIHNRNTILLNDAVEYEQNDKLREANAEVVHEVNSSITKTKRILNNADVDLKKLLESIKENKKLCTNNNTKTFISDILKKADDIKGKILKKLPETDKLHQTENIFKSINSIINEIKTNINIGELIEKMSKNIQNEIESVKGLETEEKINETITNIRNYKEDLQNKLHTVKNALESIKIKKKEMYNIFITLSSDNNTKGYNLANEYINDANALIREYDSYADKMIELINKTERELNALNDHYVKKKAMSKLTTDNTRVTENDLKNSSNEETRNKMHNEGSKSKDYSRSKEANGSFRLAGGIIFGFTICTGMVLVMFKNKVEEENNNVQDEQFEGSDNFDLNDKEEVIEVCFNDINDAS